MSKALVFFEGVSGIGKTSHLEFLDKSGEFVLYHDLCELFKISEKFSQKNNNLVIDNIYILNQIKNIEENKRNANVLYIDRSPLTSIYYNIVEKVMNSTDHESLEEYCEKCLDEYFIRSTNFKTDQDGLKRLLVSIMYMYPSIFFVTNDVEFVAKTIYERNTKLDRTLASCYNSDFNMEFCRKYVNIQNMVFKMLHSKYFTNSEICYIDNYNDWRTEKIVVCIDNVKNRFKNQTEYLKSISFNMEDKKPKKKC